MPNWTPEQQLAIDKEGTNIIVSAGAGSGKTAVLSERVIRKLKNGINVDELLLLTFTNAAAEEMKIRIRDEIKNYPELKEQLVRIDSAYITTFDAFSLSLVKKYSYLLNISKDLSIIDNAIIKLEKIKRLDKIFDNLYETDNPLFLKLINDFTLKDDKEIKELILNMNDKLDLKYDKEEYLENYINDNFNDEKINGYINEFMDILFSKIKTIRDIHSSINYGTDKFMDELDNTLNKLYSASSYQEIYDFLNSFKLPSLPKNSEEELKSQKEEISSILKEMKEICKYESTKEMKDNYLKTSDYVKIIIEIINKLDESVSEFKLKNNCYEFIDISKLAIKLVSENTEIKDELKYHFKEIMIDEYQDTSDLQETFIGLIANNNVYMVGDIKQSIYRFRNANPYIFKNKYDNYSNDNGGFKIDLVKNFRSREEVLANINYVFDEIMNDNYGGADYKVSHRMVFGNEMYIKNRKEEQNSNFEIYNYVTDKDCKFRKEEIEIFMIAKDIKEKVESKYQVVNKKPAMLRDIKYSDFAILIDQSRSFELYKKIFEYLNIPLTVYKNSSITDSDDLIIIGNILKLIKKVNDKSFDKEFKRYFMSVGRSHLFSYSDEYLFTIFKDDKYFDTSLYSIISEISHDYENLSSKELLYRIINDFSFYRNQLYVGEVEKQLARLSYLIDMFENFSNFNYTLDEIIENFNILVDTKEKIECSLGFNDGDAVKIMTIHKSKGLEFPICYFSEFFNKFNIRDLNSKFIFDNRYGFIIPSVNPIIKDNFTKTLLKEKYLNEEISEKIRLLYVALTRAKEKMIILSNIDEEKLTSITESKYRTFMDILKNVYPKLGGYIKNIDINNLGLTKDYNKIKKSNYKESIKKVKTIINYEDLNIDEEIVENESFSKKQNTLVDSDTLRNIELGKRFHYVFETIDFIKPDYSGLTDLEKRKVKAFLEQDIFKDNNYKIYKEYEFIYEEDKVKKHGIIDLILENDEEVLIIDYKLKHVVDSNYVKQLNGYKEYLSLKIDKPISIYLYSILDEKLEKLM